MPRFTPWHPGAAPEGETSLLMQVVVRPSLCRAFPVLFKGDAPDERFRCVLDTLALRISSQS